MSAGTKGVLLAALKRAVETGIGGAPEISALRNVIRDLFDHVELVSAGDDQHHLLMPVLAVQRLSDGRWDLAGSQRPVALPVETPSPIGQDTPVPCAGQYPPGFLARYCWW